MKENKKIFVDAEEWRAFQRFKHNKRYLEDCALDLEECWNSHLNYIQEEYNIAKEDFVEMDDQVHRVSDAVIDITYIKRDVKKKSCRVVEIILTEIDEPPF